MSSNLPSVLLELSYEDWAQEYLRKLPLWHFMESNDQGTQRAIVLASLALVAAQRRDFHVYNEMLVQYPRRGKDRPGQVVPDNMVVLSDEAPHPQESYNVPFEPTGPYWTLDYVSKSNPRKDYTKSFKKYERELKVPYYLVFRRDQKKLDLFRHNKRKYVRVRPNAEGRFPIPPLEMEVGLIDNWVRFWCMGKLLPLPAEMQRDLLQAQQQAATAQQQAATAQQHVATAQQQVATAQHEAAEQGKRADVLAQQLAAAERELAEFRGKSSR